MPQSKSSSFFRFTWERSSVWVVIFPVSFGWWRYFYCWVRSPIIDWALWSRLSPKWHWTAPGDPLCRVILWICSIFRCASWKCCFSTTPKSIFLRVATCSTTVRRPWLAPARREHSVIDFCPFKTATNVQILSFFLVNTHPSRLAPLPLPAIAHKGHRLLPISRHLFSA